jgi:hypothetical protein
MSKGKDSVEEGLVRQILVNDCVEVVRRGGQFYGRQGIVFAIVRKQVWVSFVFNEDGETENGWFLRKSLVVVE